MRLLYWPALCSENNHSVVAIRHLAKGVVGAAPSLSGAFYVYAPVAMLCALKAVIRRGHYLFKPLPVELGTEDRKFLQLCYSFTALGSSVRSAWASVVADVRTVKATAAPKSYTL